MTLKKGDIIEYKLPNELQFDMDVTRELKSTDGTGEVHFATLTTHMATKTARIEIVDEDFFLRLGHNKTITADITAVWDQQVIPLNSPRTFNLEGYGDITLTRILTIIEWRIRINRDLNDFTNVSIEDEIRPGQELVGTVRGHYFHDYYNPSPAKPNVALSATNSTITVLDNRHFTIKFEDLKAKGAFIYYQTRLVDPSTVEPSTTNIYNDVILKKDGPDSSVAVTGQAKINRIGGSGTADTSAVTTDIAVQKELLNRPEALKNEEFEFELVNTTNNNIVATAKNKADGQVVFNQVRFTAAGTYQYKVREKNAGQIQSGVTLSSEEIPVTIVVASNNGKLEAKVTYPTDLTFTNNYQASLAKADINMTVSLTGQTMKAEQFEFDLFDENGNLVETAKNTVDGQINFKDLPFDRAGTHKYTVRQKNGGQTLSGISHDNIVASVTVEVTDNNQGDLVALVNDPADKNFDNLYQTSPTIFDITAAKLLKGRDAKPLTAGEFNFRLESEDGQELYQASNRADGSIVFENLSFASAGTYRFRLSEGKGADPQITYDNQVYQLEVQVTDKGDGSLEAKLVSAPITITNNYTAGTTSVPVKVAWDDANNQDGKRQAVTARLFADGQDTGKTLVLDQANGWSATFENVDADKTGKEILYTVVGDGVPAYNSHTPTEDAGSGFVLPYSYTPETITITAKKNWDDANNQDGKRPSSITVKLMANGKEVASKEVSPDATGKWETSFANQPKYANGKEIVYTLDEIEVADYQKVIKDFTITNSRTPETVNYQVTKVWNDRDNQDGKRPATISVQLFKSVGGASPTAVTGKTLTLSAAKQKDANTWVASFTDLPKYEAGQEITYSVQEDATGLPAGYTTSVTGQTITNTYTPSTVTISGTNVWDDANNQDGKRPEKITVELQDDKGNVVASQEVTPGADGKWSFNFPDLPQYNQGQEIKYQVVAKAVEFYQTSITEDANNKGQFTLTHVHSPEQMIINGLVTWSDLDDKDKLRPSEVTITLYANDKPVATTKASSANGWQYSFDPVDRYDNGQEIQYRINATAASGYELAINGFTIHQTHVPVTSPSDDGGTTNPSTNVGRTPSSTTSKASVTDPATKGSGTGAKSVTRGQRRVLPRTNSEQGMLLIQLGLISLTAGLALYKRKLS